MNTAEIELPSNRKFGFVFFAVFTALSGYFFLTHMPVTAGVFAGLAVLFVLVTLIRAELLEPLNRLWMRFGLLLGKIVSPVVMGVIFFFLFTPIALLMRVSGRDELRLRKIQSPSYWKPREPNGPSAESFKHQF